MEKYGVLKTDSTPCCICGKPSSRIISQEAFCDLCDPSDFSKTANYAKTHDSEMHKWQA